MFQAGINVIFCTLQLVGASSVLKHVHSLVPGLSYIFSGSIPHIWFDDLNVTLSLNYILSLFLLFPCIVLCTSITEVHIPT
jgi:hypothetical protein